MNDVKMNNSVVIPSNVLSRVKYLPESDRQVITNALIEEYIHGANPEDMLSPFQAMICLFMKYYIKRDSARSAI